MVVSLNSVAGFTSTVNYQNVPKVGFGSSMLKASNFPSPSRMFIFTRPLRVNNKKPNLLVAKAEPLLTETTSQTSENTKTPIPNDQSSASSEPKQDTDNANITKPIEKRSKLTAREKLKAARVRSRFTEPKPVKKLQLGSKVLEALRESDKLSGKKSSGLPEAPTNMLDDSKRGMPKKGLTFELPVGWDVFLIILSVVVISTIMFTTTFIVWKMGAIHFNEY